jgi:hypothetical protein
MKMKCNNSRNSSIKRFEQDIHSTEEGITVNHPKCFKQCNIMATLRSCKIKPYKTTEKKQVYTIRKIASKEYNKTVEWIDFSAYNSAGGNTPLHPLESEL